MMKLATVRAALLILAVMIGCASSQAQVLYPVTNFATVTASVGYDNAATTIVLSTGDGNKLPSTFPFFLVWWDSTLYASPDLDPNVEIIQVDNRVSDTLTVVRGQDGTNASNHNTATSTYKLTLSFVKAYYDKIDQEIVLASNATDDLTAVLARGRRATILDSLANALVLGDGIREVAIYGDATDGIQIVCVMSGVVNDCHYSRKLNAGKYWQVTNSSGTSIFRVSADTGAITNATLDEEASGNNITRVMEIVVPLAGCVGASAFSNLNDDATGATAPTAACNDTGSIQDPSLDFSGSAVNTAQLPKFRLPTGWTGNIDLTIRYVTVAASPTGNVEWDIATVCRGIAESWDASFNAAQTITDAVGSQNQANDATQTAVTATGCAAGEDLTIKISRDGVNDTNNDLAKATEAIITVRATK